MEHDDMLNLLLINREVFGVWSDDHVLILIFRIGDIVFTFRNAFIRLNKLKLDSSILNLVLSNILRLACPDPLAWIFNAILEAEFILNEWLIAHV